MRVLLVDDSPQFAQAATRFLSAVPDMEIVGHARSGMEALELALQLHPTLVLMDVIMPEMDGLETTRRMKRMAMPPQIIVLTLHDNAEYRYKARLAGADGFVSKIDFGTKLVPMIHDLQSMGESPRTDH